MGWLEDNWPLFAIGGGLYLAGTAVESLTDEQRAARAQTNTGAPTDVPGQALVGEPDYIRIWKGQKIEALKRFGVSAADNVFGSPEPVTPRSYALGEVLAYWVNEINRLCGLKGSGGVFGDVTGQAAARVGKYDVFIGGAFYRGMVNFESAEAMVASWNRIGPKLEAAIRDGLPLGQPPNTGVLTTDGTRRFWDELRGLAIAVDVDRAVPDSAGLAWEAIVESAKELPGRVGDAARAVASAGGSVIWDVVTGLVPLPVLLAAGGIAVWLYRENLTAMYRRVF